MSDVSVKNRSVNAIGAAVPLGDLLRPRICARAAQDFAAQEYDAFLGWIDSVPGWRHSLTGRQKVAEAYAKVGDVALAGEHLQVARRLHASTAMSDQVASAIEAELNELADGLDLILGDQPTRAFPG